MAERASVLTTPAVLAPSPRRFKFQPPVIAGVAILAILAFTAVFAPFVAPYDPTEQSGIPFEAPSAAHLLGTNDIGQDILSELIWGSRISLSIGVLAALLATLIGTTVGIVGGYYRGAVDAFLMRLVDVVLALPFLPLMILLAAFLGPSMFTIIIVVGLIVWARPSRIIRSQILSLAGRDYITAARAVGAGHGWILTRHLLPAVAALSVVEFVQAAAGAILIESSLSFLGLGDPTAKSWGSILYYAQARSAFLSGSWVWWVIPPGLAITLTVMGFALLAFALERIANPRLSKR